MGYKRTRQIADQFSGSTVRKNSGQGRIRVRDPGLANADMADGYKDGLADNRLEFPESLDNRGRSYRHGWLSGLADRTQARHQAGKTFGEIVAAADEAIEEDKLP